MEVIKICVEDNEEKRIDLYLTSKIEDFSRVEIQDQIRAGNILVNNRQVKPSYIIKSGDEISLELVEDKALELIPENLNLDIVYQDNHLAVINKPSGMVVHPGAGNPSSTLVNGILYELDSLGNSEDKLRPGIVHRLDKDTSGLMLVAKSDLAYEKLVEMFRNKEVKRKYLALVQGVIYGEGLVDQPIGRHGVNRQLMTVTHKNSKRAVTHYKVLENFDNYTLVEARLETGRTHQIRVHMKHLNYPLLGDPIYSSGKNEFGLKRQFLHSYKLEFKHPISGELLEFKSDLPEELYSILSKLRKRRGFI